MPPVHWHKLPWRQLISHEIRRDGFKPFFIGMGISAFLCGVVPSMGFTDEDRKNSVYYQQRMRTMKYEDH
ncbi:unnamed protein product [Ectocarpus sp. 8 AP-2014]